MTGDNRYLNDFLDAMIADNLHQKIRWVCNSRVDDVDLNTMKKMKQAGCHQVMYGVENINGIVLKNIKKKIKH